MKRYRPLRIHPVLREALTQTRLDKRDFIYPLFVIEGSNLRNPVPSMPDVFQLSIDSLLEECKRLLMLGIRSILLFGIPKSKDSIGSDALSDNGIIARAIRELKSAFGTDLLVIADVCFCEYTDHGHCGILDSNGILDNDLTLEILQKQSLCLARAGADMLAPSGMLDGMISAMREVLDTHGFYNLPIMSYSTKFASAYYGPFRDVAQSTPQSGDRKSYQQNPANRNEAILESLNDERENADILMVKPALAYLDIVRDIREKSLLPLAVYNVSGEYSMLKLAGDAGVVDYDRILLETMIGFKRAGADLIISYHTKELFERGLV
ncbi:MAG: porphobilinogen synthase [Helicobacter sp.]|nr:porphobilinogen synthase [Helicobacter sp.]MDE7196113.1 porphobilinogen synthase [Helicobacter sp.]